MDVDRLEIARRQLSYDPDIPEDADLEVLAVVPILWSGWECDHEGVLYRIRPDGEPKLHILGGVHVIPESLIETLEYRIEAYEKAAANTRDFLEKARACLTSKS